MALNGLLASMNGNSTFNCALGGAAGGVLVSALTDKTSARTLLKTGGLLAMGGLAWLAYNRYRIGQKQRGAISPAAIPRRQFEAVLDPRNEKSALGLVLQAMIAAAHADHLFSEEDQRHIWQRAMDLGATGAELAALTETMADPPSLDELVLGADKLETRIEMYIASCMVIDERCGQGRHYLRQFAGRLQLPPPLVEALRIQANSERVAA